jgi:hypothetical protein
MLRPRHAKESVHNELTKVKIKWPQLVRDEDIRKTYTMTQKTITLI